MKKISKMRLDQLLVLQGLAKNRTQAHSMIMAGRIYSGTICLNKAGHQYSQATELEVRGKPHPWVSRGGIKLDHAINEFDINPKGKICIDIGASSGGFTDVLLHRGATSIYAVDVGYGQLDWKLRSDNRVIVIEKFNVRNLSKDQIPNEVDLLVADLSFISLEKALPSALALVKKKAELVALIKPQFEVGKGQIGKGGVVRNSELHKNICKKICMWINNLSGWGVVGLIESPIRGPAGNTEFLVYAKKYGKI